MESHFHNGFVTVILQDSMNSLLPLLGVSNLAVAVGHVHVDVNGLARRMECCLEAGDEVALDQVRVHVEGHGAAKLQAVILVQKVEAVDCLVPHPGRLHPAALNADGVCGKLSDGGNATTGTRWIHQCAAVADRADIVCGRRTSGVLALTCLKNMLRVSLHTC